MSFVAIDMLGTIIVLGTIFTAIAIIFSAVMLLRPGWRYAWLNGGMLLPRNPILATWHPKCQLGVGHQWLREALRTDKDSLMR